LRPELATLDLTDGACDAPDRVEHGAAHDQVHRTNQEHARADEPARLMAEGRPHAALDRTRRFGDHHPLRALRRDPDEERLPILVIHAEALADGGEPGRIHRPTGVLGGIRHHVAPRAEERHLVLGRGRRIDRMAEPHEERLKTRRGAEGPARCVHEARLLVEPGAQKRKPRRILAPPLPEQGTEQHGEEDQVYR
jgi:hypothetical protein